MTISGRSVPRAAPSETERVADPERTDGELIERVGDGDRDAFDELYRRYARPVLGLALRRLGDVAIAEGRADRAARHLEHALQLSRRLGAPAETARALARLAVAADLLGDPRRAQRCARECPRILTDLELPDACLRLPPHLRQARSEPPDSGRAVRHGAGRL